ncbi:MAG TPA: radical SAM protein [Gammaproteobacteria bacterium]|nr:radical SAM protein [Gammaproteobacteria bacterium]
MSEPVVSNATVDDVIAYELHGNCYLNITDHCTLRCAFCPKFNKTFVVQGYDLRLKHAPGFEQVVAAVGDVSRYQEIVFCGLGEPTQRLPLLLQLAQHFKAQGATIRVNSDGLASLLHGRDVTPELAGKIDALSISMNAHNEAVYNRHCRPKKEYPGAYQAMLTFACRAKAFVPSVTLTAIDGLAGVDIDACREIAADLGVQFRRRELDVVG